jgi:DNA mismatch repair ATPase MutS
MFETRKQRRERLSDSFGKLKNDYFNFESIDKYFRKKDNSGSFQVLSDKTCNDLDFNQLFMLVDRTTSKVGQQFLYNALRTIPVNSDKLSEQEKLIRLLSDDAALRLNLQIHLDALTGDSAYYIRSLFQEEHIKKPKWFFVVPLLSFTSLLSILLLPFTPQFFFVLIGVVIINLGIHYWNKQNLYGYLVSVPQLLRLNRVAKELIKYDVFKDIRGEYKESISVIDRVRNRMFLFKLESKLESEISMIFWSVLELFKALFLLEPLLLFGVLKQLDTKRKEIEKVFSFVGYIDSLISIASLRNGLGQFCLPEITDKNKTLEAKDMYHPLIADCVQNSLYVADRSILLTGSNMSGKTSFIRTVGLNVITGLTINTCFASSFCLSRLRVYSAIRLSDDLMNNKSYYFEEVLTIKEMIDQSQTTVSNLFLLDEIFKGTNTIERISAGKAVLSFLNTGSNIVFVSTHDIELAELLTDSYELYHFSEQVNNNNVDFDFKLKNGKLKNRNAIRILEINNYPEQVIKEAIEISRELDKIFIVNKLVQSN